MSKLAKIRISLICGGPSLERGISLNSARTVLDHLESDMVEVVPFYVDYAKTYYKISTSQLYSNTPSDFDFKLQTNATKLSPQQFIKELKKTDIAFPVMHGQFGEDGKIQYILEQNKIPFIGSGSEACKKLFDKFIANESIKEAGFHTLPSEVLKIYDTNHEQIIQKFFKDHKLTKAIVKPARGGSSIGVFSVNSPEEALEKVTLLFSKRMDTRVVIEKFAVGREFTVILVENEFGMAVPLLPTEIETDYTENQIFDFRRKYLPTRQVTWHCPPRFNQDIIESIQVQAQNLFSFFGMKGFARFDGWVLEDGKIWFSDFNPVSGMEQNSFLFQQSAKIGMTHREILEYIVTTALPAKSKLKTKGNKPASQKKNVRVIAGGSNAERQVSLMSGTNVWLKLRNSEEFQPQFYFQDIHGSIWKLPYHLSLNHTVEEITQNCENYKNEEKIMGEYIRRARKQLMFSADRDEEEFFAPIKISLEEFLGDKDFVFIALHGGAGENGDFQKLLEQNNIRFNGSGSTTSSVCMNKFRTAQLINDSNTMGIAANNGVLFETIDLLSKNKKEVIQIWDEITNTLKASSLIIKPNDDGCSSGIVRLFSPTDLNEYLRLMQSGAQCIPPQSIKNQREIVELPLVAPEQLLLEKFVETDVLRIKNNTLKHHTNTGWVECTVGVLESDGSFHSLNPSITVAEGEVLTVEEKFQGGTGVNITPMPMSLISTENQDRIKSKIKQVAKIVGIKGYARIDIFVELETGDIQVIEVNTLPAMTPSTVLYHQGLAENDPIFPTGLIEKIINNS